MSDNLLAFQQEKSDVAQRLRSETHNAHCQIEEVMSDLLFAEPLDLAAYKHMLNLHRRYYQQIETALMGFESTASMMPERSKIDWLNSDIRYLETHSANKYNADGSPIELNARLPANEAQAWGFMYVFEGATLGGGHIIDKLRHLRDFQQHQGLRFFQSYGRNTPAMWQKFKLSLQQYVSAHAGCEEQLIEGANASFSNMYKLMKGVHVA